MDFYHLMCVIDFENIESI